MKSKYDSYKHKLILNYLGFNYQCVRDVQAY